MSRLAPVLGLLGLALLSASVAAEETPVVHRTEHYELQTTTDQALLKTAGDHLELAHRVYAKILPYARRTPLRNTFRVRIFSTRDALVSYREEGGERSDRFAYRHRSLDHPRNEVAGYRLPDRLLRAKLVHEGFHQYLQSFINKPPQWINEGLAEYLEACDLGADGSFKAVLGIDRGWIRQWRERLRSEKSRDYVPLREILLGSREEFLGHKKSGYCESWGFCHFLLESGDVALRDRLASYLKALEPEATRDENAKAAFDAAFGNADLDALERKFVAFMDGLESPAYRLFLSAQKLRAEKRWEDAAAEAGRALEKEPDSFTLLYYRGMSYLKLSRFEDAQRDLEKAVEIAPEYEAAHVGLAQAQAQLKKYAAARASLAVALKLSPSPALRKTIDEWLAKIDAWEKGGK